MISGSPAPPTRYRIGSRLSATVSSVKCRCAQSGTKRSFMLRVCRIRQKTERAGQCPARFPHSEPVCVRLFASDHLGQLARREFIAFFEVIDEPHERIES